MSAAFRSSHPPVLFAPTSFLPLVGACLLRPQPPLRPSQHHKHERRTYQPDENLPKRLTSRTATPVSTSQTLHLMLQLEKSLSTRAHENSSFGDSMGSINYHVQILALIVIDCSYLRFHTFFTLGPKAQLFCFFVWDHNFRPMPDSVPCSDRDNENDPSKSCSTVPNLRMGAIYARPKITKWIYRTSSRTSTDSERANDVRYPSCDFLAKSYKIDIAPIVANKKRRTFSPWSKSGMKT